MSHLESGVAACHPLRVARGWLFLTCACAFLVLFTQRVPSTVQGADDTEADYRDLFRDLGRSLNSYYLDLDRVKPRVLLEKAFGALEFGVDEIYVENSDPHNPVVTVHVDGKTESFDLGTVKDLPQAIKLLDSVFVFIKANYRGETKLNTIRYAAANGFLSGLDPHTLVFSPEEFKDFSVHIKGEICGVGMYVGSRDGKLKVIEVLKGWPRKNPAEKAGFKKGDLIDKIGDESTINMTVSEAVDKIRGQCGSSVTLTVKRAAADDTETLETKEIAVERDTVTIKSVESKLIKDWNDGREGPWKGGVGYVQVINFDEKTTPTLVEHLGRLKVENGDRPLAGLILDLRNNSGGLLKQAIDMSDLFLEDGEIVLQASRINPIATERADRDGTEPEYPIVVLANEQSASGAEIVIGALQKNNRAIVLGSRTFGKGSVQQLHQLKHAAQLKITVSEYLIPGMISIQENGVIPDILAQQTGIDDAGQFDLFPDERAAGERNYEKHIVSKYSRKETPSYTLHYLFEPEEVDTESDRFISGDLAPEKDKLAQMALSLLRLAGKPYNPGAILKEKKAEIAALQDELLAEIIQRLKKEGVDWSADPSGKPSDAPAADLALELSSEVIQEPSKEKDDPVPVSKLRLTARLTNKGSKPLYRLKGLSKSEYFAYKDQEFFFGKLEPGQTVERTSKVRLPYFPTGRNDLVTVEVSSTGDFPAGDAPPSDSVLTQKSLAVEIQDAGRPAFAYTASLFDATSGEPLRRLQEGKKASLKVQVKNIGNRPAHKGVAILRNETGRQVFLQKGRIEFKDLAPRAATEVEFLFEVREGEPVEVYKLELAAFDAYSNAVISRKLSIPHVSNTRAEPFLNGSEFAPPSIAANLVDPETNKQVLLTGKDSLRLEAIITAADPDSVKAWIMTSVVGGEHEQLPDKILFASAAGKDELKIDTAVPLKKGINLFTVVSNARGLESRQNFVVRRE